MEKYLIGGNLAIVRTYDLYSPKMIVTTIGEAIEILLQVMENNRDELALILTKYKVNSETLANATLNFVLA